jgi:hypothetical protein
VHTQTQNSKLTMESPPDDPSPSTLHSAVKLADLIHRQSSSKSTFPQPGLVEGLAVGVGTALALTPVRSQIIKRTPQLGQLPDLIVTSSQAVVAAMSGLYAGSLYGATTHLEHLANIPQHAVSPTANSICEDELIKRLLSEPSQSDDGDLAEWDPRRRTLQAYANALENCRVRLQQREQGQTSDSISREGWWR